MISSPDSPRRRDKDAKTCFLLSVFSLEKNKQLLFCFFPLTIKTFADDLKNVSRRHKRPTAAAGVRPQIDADEREASQKNGFCNGAQVLSGESSPWSDAERVFVLFRGGKLGHSRTETEPRKTV